MDQAELLQQVQTATAAIKKIGGETRSLLTAIDKLTLELANANVTSPEIDAAISELNAAYVAVDGLVPDVADTPAPAPAPAPAPGGDPSTGDSGSSDSGSSGTTGDASTQG